MDLNFTLSPSPSKKLRPGSSVVSPLVSGSPLRDGGVRSAARDLLSGALKEAIKKDEEDDMPSDIDSLPSPMKKLMASGMSPLSSPSKSARKRKRKEEDKSSGYHHTFVMKLFDRSVDLAQFHDERSTYPLYPVARAWIKNEPSNLSLAPRDRSPTPEPEEEEEESDCTDADVYHLPAPDPLPGVMTSARMPPPPLSHTLTSDIDLDLENPDPTPGPVLLSNHLVKWWGVKKSWKQAALQNEKRYAKSMIILKDMFEK